MCASHPPRALALFCLIATLSASVQPARANSEMRDWALTSGESMRGEIEMVDEIAGTVRLRSDDGKESVVQMDQFSNIDRAWILEWLELGEELKELIKKFGGRMEHFEGKGATLTTGFHVYHPSGAIAPGTPRPMMILFDPAGKPERYLTRHLEAAEQTKITLVTCEHIRNGQTAEETLARFKELFPLIQKSVPHDPKRIFLGGTSGGALNAFYFPASMPEIPWAGIYSNGGWLGAEYERPYPATKVAMVNGDRDVAANGWLDADSAVLQKRGATVVVIAFEGAHQIPPVSVQVKAFKWLLGELK